MPIRIGLLVYPVFLTLVAISKGGPVGRLMKAGAISPETARKPESLGVNDPRVVQSWADDGLLIAVGDGRYYVNVAAYRGRKRLLIANFAMIGVAGIALAWWLW